MKNDSFTYIFQRISLPYRFHAFCWKSRETLNLLRCTIWYYLHNLKNVKNTPEGMLLLVKLQAMTINWNLWYRDETTYKCLTINRAAWSMQSNACLFSFRHVPRHVRVIAHLKQPGLKTGIIYHQVVMTQNA